MKNFTVQPGDIIVSCAGTIGETYILPPNIERGIINQALMRMTIYAPLNIDFFLLYFDYVLKESARNISKGSAIKNIPPFSIFKQLIFPIPPLAEQLRIVQKLHMLQPLIEEYDKQSVSLNLLNDSFPEKLKKSILQWAVQGKLVLQDPDDEPASVLLEKIRSEKERLIQEGKIKRNKHESIIYRRGNSYYEKIDGGEHCIDDEIPFGIPNSWTWCRLKTITAKIGAGSTPVGGRNVYVTNGIKFIRSQNVYDDGLRLDDIVFIPNEINEKKSRSIVYPKDILLNITGGSIGRCVLIPDDFDIGNVNQHVMIIRCILPSIRYWLHTVLISKYVQSMIINVQVGVSREGLSATKLMNFLIPMPPIHEQKQIKQKISELEQLYKELR